MRHHSVRSLVGLAVLLLVACKGPVVQSPLTGQSRYLCCNMRYEKTVITDVNYQQGTLIPVGTPVQILEVRTNQVLFQAAGHPPLTLKYDFGRKANIPFETYLERVFVTEDPRTALRSRVPRRTARGKGKGKAPAARPSDDGGVLELIERGTVEPGMTRAQVLMALGYPPAHRTPSLDASEWHYWRNRWKQFVVVFAGDKVERIVE